jgi:hypothetical protein
MVLLMNQKYNRYGIIKMRERLRKFEELHPCKKEVVVPLPNLMEKCKQK